MGGSEEKRFPKSSHKKIYIRRKKPIVKEYREGKIEKD